MRAAPNAAAAAFPNAGELAAAAALLLLSSSSPPPPPPPPPPPHTLSDALSSSSSTSASAASCVSDSTSRARPVDPLRVLAVVASLRRIDPKVLAKATSAMFQGEETKKRKGVWFEVDGDDGDEKSAAAGSESSTVTTSVSGSSTATSGKGGGHRPPPTSGGGGGRLWRRAKVILEWLSLPEAAPATEGAIRAAVGDNADTSKALRLLMKKGGGVRRAGTGCRGDPYVYMVAGRHSEVNSH